MIWALNQVEYDLTFVLKHSMPSSDSITVYLGMMIYQAFEGLCVFVLSEFDGLGGVLSNSWLVLSS